MVFKRKVRVSGVFGVAGNEKSGNVISFRMSEAELRKKIEQFRQEYQSGDKGMVTWPRFCAFLGYSVEEVRECYIRGRNPGSAYGGRADLLLRFRTECKALTLETGEGKLTLARDEANTDYLTIPGMDNEVPTIQVLFGDGHGHWMEAMK